MIIGMTLQQAMIVELVHKTSYDHRYGLSVGKDYRTCFSASCDISFHDPVYIHYHHLVLLTVTPEL
jgi:hypothetical protein